MKTKGLLASNLSLYNSSQPGRLPIYFKNISFPAKSRRIYIYLPVK